MRLSEIIIKNHTQHIKWYWKKPNRLAHTKQLSTFSPPGSPYAKCANIQRCNEIIYKIIIIKLNELVDSGGEKGEESPE